MQILVTSLRFGDGDDLVLGFVEALELMLYGFEVVCGEGGPEQDLGPVGVWRGGIDGCLAEAVPEGVVGVVGACAGGTEGGATERRRSGTEGGEKRTTGERGNGQLRHGLGPL